MIALTAESVTDLLHTLIPASRRLDIEILEAESGHAVGLMPLAGNENHLGTMYAGSLFVLAEITAGALAMATIDFDRLVPIVRDMNISYHAPARTPVRAYADLRAEVLRAAEASVEQTGRAVIELAIHLRDEESTLVATARGSFDVRRSPQS